MSQNAKSRLSAWHDSGQEATGTGGNWAGGLDFQTPFAGWLPRKQATKSPSSMARGQWLCLARLHRSFLLPQSYPKCPSSGLTALEWRSRKGRLTKRETGVGRWIFPEPVGLWPRAVQQAVSCPLCLNTAHSIPRMWGQSQGLGVLSQTVWQRKRKPQRSQAKTSKEVGAMPHLTERNAGEALAGGGHGPHSSSHSSFQKGLVFV